MQEPIENLQRPCLPFVKFTCDPIMHLCVNNVDQQKKSKTIEFLGQDPLRCKIVAVNKCLQHGKNFKHLGCKISYENGKDSQPKQAKYVQILGIIHNTFNPTLVQKFSIIKVYNTLVLPHSLYESEIWTLEKIIKKRLASTEMKIFRIAGTTFFDHNRHEDGLEQLTVEQDDEKLRRYK